MRIARKSALPVLLLIANSLFVPACVSTGVRSSGSELPQASTTFGDGQLKVEIDHNCSQRCESFKASFENLSASPVEVLVARATLRRGAEKFFVRRLGESKGNIVIPPRSKASAEFAPFSAANGRRLTYVVPKAVWCSIKTDSACKKNVEADAQCAGYARGYFTVYKEAEGWVLISFAYKSGDRTALVQSAPPDTGNFSGPSEIPVVSENAPAFFREPDNSVFYKIECNDKCKCQNITKPRSYSEDGLKPFVEPIP